MFDRYWNYTTCIRSNNLAAIEQVVAHLLKQEEGCRHLAQPPQLTIDPEELYRQPWVIWSKLWIIGLFVGTGGWTGIKTWPPELFCKRAFGASRPRLSALTMQLGCEAFHLKVYQSTWGFLLEADAAGHTFISGSAGSDAQDNYQFYEEQIDAPGLVSQFRLLQVPLPMQVAMQVNEDSEIIRREVKFDRLMAENLDSELLAELINEVSKGHTQRIDCALAEVMDGSHNYWNLQNLAYYVYAKPQWLPARAQLLYFQPPTTYSLPHPYTIPPLQTNTASDLDAQAYEDEF